jgi:hypothetical protein
MKHARIQQRDFFDPAPDLNTEPVDAVEMEAPRGEPIAIPCGFMTKNNERCQRRANRPVMLEGHQMTCRGRPMLFCDPACYNASTPADVPAEEIIADPSA